MAEYILYNRYNGMVVAAGTMELESEGHKQTFEAMQALKGRKVVWSGEPAMRKQQEA